MMSAALRSCGSGIGTHHSGEAGPSASLSPVGEITDEPIGPHSPRLIALVSQLSLTVQVASGHSYKSPDRSQHSQSMLNRNYSEEEKQDRNNFG